MSRILLLSAFSLVAAAFLFPAAGAQAGDTCVEYAYVADYNWYYLCVSTRSACPIYEKHVSGVTETRTCLVSLPAVGTSIHECTPYTGDIDHQFRFCVVGDTDCPVYEEFTNGTVKCYA